MKSASFKVSRNVQRTISPPIPLARKWAASYVPKPGRPLINMSQGVPGDPPHPSLVKALGDVVTGNYQGYGYDAVEGYKPLREALADEMKSVYGPLTDVSAEDVVLTSGCNLAFVATVMSLADAGDEVILPVPWYFNHQMTLSLLGIQTVALPTTPESKFQPSVEACQRLITPRTKAIALITPNNPTGAVYPPSLLASFLELARSKGIALILDETYRDFVLPGPPHDLFALPKTQSGPSWRSNLIHLFSFSKSYGVPGLRLGAILACPSHSPSLVKILDTLQICPSVPGQIALASVMPSLRTSIRTSAESVARRHDVFEEALPKGWEIGAQGGFFAYVKHPFKGVSAQEVCRRLALEEGVVLLPGEFFAEEQAASGEQEENRWIRVSVANVGEEDIRKACERLRECEEKFGWSRE